MRATDEWWLCVPAPDGTHTYVESHTGTKSWEPPGWKCFVKGTQLLYYCLEGGVVPTMVSHQAPTWSYKDSGTGRQTWTTGPGLVGLLRAGYLQPSQLVAGPFSPTCWVSLLDALPHLGVALPQVVAQSASNSPILQRHNSQVAARVAQAVGPIKHILPAGSSRLVTVLFEPSSALRLMVDESNTKGSWLDDDLVNLMLRIVVAQSKESIVLTDSFLYSKLTHAKQRCVCSGPCKCQSGPVDCYDFAAVEKQTKRLLKRTLSAKYLLMPINILGLHWFLVVVFLNPGFEEGAICVVDQFSLDGSTLPDWAHCIVHIRRWLQDGFKSLDAELSANQAHFLTRKWPKVKAELPWQRNDFDCGVFVIGVAMGLSTHGSIESLSSHVNADGPAHEQCIQLRQKILETVLEPFDGRSYA